MNKKAFIFILLGIFFIISCRVTESTSIIIESDKLNKNVKITTKIETKNIDSSIIYCDMLMLNSIVEGSNKMDVEDSTKSNSTIEIVNDIKKDSFEIITENTDKLLITEANRIKEEKKEALEWDIKQLNSNKIEAKNKYSELHEYFERYIKVEATSRQLNINYYTYETIRLNTNQTGIEFTVTSSFPQDISEKVIIANTEKLATTTVTALSRYEHVSMIDYESINFALEIKYYGNNAAVEKYIKSEFDKLNISYNFIKTGSEEMFLQIQIISLDIFKKDYQEWIKKEQQINRKIRIKQMQLQKLLKE